MKKIKFLIMDVDGTLTDGKIYMGTKGEFVKTFNIKDGYGIHDLLIPSGIIPIVITGRESIILKNRCNELGIKMVFQGILDKREIIKKITKKYNISLNNIAYIGDDLNDLPCMNDIKSGGGVVGCPKDASKEVKNVANYISNLNGGAGAVRDFIEWILKIIDKI